ncbi:MAG: DUF2778 domain-containing protein [Rhizobiaceae bacterium]|nr:DUF2778 domain-containing protein [Rhizobiaceae bacterium]
MLGFPSPLEKVSEIPLPKPARAVIETILPGLPLDKVNAAQRILVVPPASQNIATASFHFDGEKIARKFSLAQTSQEKSFPDRFDAARAKANLTREKLASLFPKPVTRKSDRPVAIDKVPAEERFATMPPIVTTSQNPVLMAFAAPGQEHSAVDAFSALLAEDEAENTASLSDDNVGAQEGEDGAFDPTPSEAPLPQLRSNVQPPLKPLGSARQIEGAKDDSSTKPEAKPQALAYARPDAPERGTFGQSFRNLFGGAKAGNGVAVYDISAAKVYMPDGTVLEAHSGIGKMADNPRYVNVKMGGATPPHVYNLKMRERLFHGVEAIRMLPVDGKNKFGRDGFLTHSYLLRGGRAESHGCVAFKDYNRFLKAFKQGKVKQIVVVSSGGRAAGVRMASNY